MQCSNCGNQMPDTAKFCPKCGNPAKAQLLCPNCGRELKPEAKFCPGCGQPTVKPAAQQKISSPTAQPSSAFGPSPTVTQGPPIVIPQTQTYVAPPPPTPGRQIPGTPAYSPPPVATGPAKQGDKPPLTWGNFFKTVLTKTWQGMLRSIPMMILVFLISMVVHTYLLVVYNEGFGAGTWVGNQLLATQGHVISGTLLWMLLSGFLFMSVPRIKQMGFGRFFSELAKTPGIMADYVKQAGGDGLLLLLSGAGVSLIIASIMSSATSLVTAVGLAAVFASPVGRVLAILIQTSWTTLVASINPNQAQAQAAFGVVPAYVALVGTSLGFVGATIIPFSGWVGVLMLIAVAVMLYNNSRPGGTTTAGMIFFLITVAIMVLKAKGVLADDGGWAETGGNFQSWVQGEGSVRAVLHGTGPSLGAAIGPSLTSALSGISPDDFSITSGATDDKEQEETQGGEEELPSEPPSSEKEEPEGSEGEEEEKTYDEDGYDEDGYDRDGYDRDGYDRNGYDRNGYDRDGYDRNGYDANGFDRDGYDRDGYDANGFDRNGYDREGFDSEGYDKNGFDKNGFDRDGYDKDGYDANGFDRDGYDRDGYDANGYDREGYDREGFDSEGYDKNGFDKSGFDRDGYDKDGYDANGYDREGYDKDGYDYEGYDRNGFDQDGYDREGYDRNGYDANGFDRDGYDRNGYDANGFDREGFDRNGYDREGYDRDGYNKKGFNRDGVNREGKTFAEVIQELKEKMAHLEKEQAAANSSAWWWNVGTQSVEWVQFGADKSIDLLEKLTGPAGQNVKMIYTVAKGTAEGLGEAIADGKDYVSHIAKGTAKGVVDLGLDKLKDAVGGKITDATGGKLPGFKDYSPFNPGDEAWKNARTGFVKKALLGQGVDKSVTDMVRDKFATAGKAVIQDTIKDKLSKDPIMDKLFGKE